MFPKPAKGTALLERKTRQKEHKAREADIMQEAKRRDSHLCRVPRCPYRSMPIDPCHQVHRGMGGNPKEDRTTLDTVIALCRIHHGEYDRGDLDIEPMTPAVFSGACAFYEQNHVGLMVCIGVEKVIGVSVERGQ